MSSLPEWQVPSADPSVRAHTYTLAAAGVAQATCGTYWTTAANLAPADDCHPRCPACAEIALETDRALATRPGNLRLKTGAVLVGFGLGVLCLLTPIPGEFAGVLLFLGAALAALALFFL